MRKIIVITLFGLMWFGQSFAQDMDYIRDHFLETPTDEALWEELSEELNKENLDNLELGYAGGLQMIGAKYSGNPFTKLSDFKKGKKKVEEAIKTEPENIELHYLRLVIQKFAPRFLGYHKQIDSDRAFLRENLHKVQSEDLKELIKKILEEE